VKILVIADAWDLPPLHYGGADRMCYMLCEGLQQNGFTVNLMAGSGSKKFNGRFFSFKNQSTTYHSRIFRRIDFSLKSFLLSVDVKVVISFKFWPEYHSVINKLGIPVIYVQQNTGLPSDLARVLKCNPKYGYMQCLTYDQASQVNIIDSSRIFVIPNAVNVSLIKPPLSSGAGRWYLSYLGRLNYDKGIDLAVQASLKTGVPLKIAGVVRPNEPEAARLFEQNVAPYLCKNIEFVGPIRDSEKSAFLGQSIALLMPNRWREPFGIVMAEALAAGTPVIGTNLGSIPEIIDHGVTGYICSSFHEICEAIPKVKYLSSQDCRSAAISRFSKENYIDNVTSMICKVL